MGMTRPSEEQVPSQPHLFPGATGYEAAKGEGARKVGSRAWLGERGSLGSKDRKLWSQKVKQELYSRGGWGVWDKRGMSPGGTLEVAGGSGRAWSA